MKKYALIGVVIIAILIAAVFFDRQSSSQPQAETIEYTLNNQKLRLLVADTPEEQAKGLMHYRELKDADGMIFIFERKEPQSFWNKNTFMDLDVYWIDNKQVVGKGFLPSIEKSKTEVTINSPKPVNVVIEIPRE